jgi:predicted ester cyclase
MRIMQEDLIAEEEKLARRFTFCGTHKGDYWGVPASGKFVSAAGQMILHFKSGKCIETWQLNDSVGFLVTIGALPTFVPKR